jgi:CoA-transferase family III
MIAALHAAMADEAARLHDAARAIGNVVAFDPRAALARDLVLDVPGQVSPNGHCRLFEAKDGWLAVNLARPDDRDAVPAWLGCDAKPDVWDGVAEGVAGRDTAALIDHAILLGLPVAVAGEAATGAQPVAEGKRDRPSGVPHVIDLSALWAGPYCGALLAEAGCIVTKIESASRPDPTFHATPELHRRLNGAKAREIVNPAEFAARAVDADVVITSARPHALAWLGLTPEALFAANPSLIWVAITAHGWTGDAAMRVGFGDDCAAAGGLLDWRDGVPSFVGDALADPLTGLYAARLALEALRDGRCGLIDVALASTAAMFAQTAGYR